jgi:DNA repair exonuclease SbcCD ATPase subunit
MKALQEKTEKLKAHTDSLSSEVQKLQQELAQHQQVAAKLDIELSVLHDAFREKFPGVSDRDRADAITAMSHLSEVERLESELKHEQGQTIWCRGELDRLAALTPQRQLEDVDVADLTRQQEEMMEELQNLKIRNSRREKAIRVSQSKIESELVEVQDLQEKLAEKEEIAQANLEMKKKAEDLAKEIAELAEQFKAENAVMHDIQDQLSSANREKERIIEFINGNEETIRENGSWQDELIAVLKDLDDQNRPMREIKARYEVFTKRTAELKETLGDQLGQIADLIGTLRRRT